MDKLHLQQLNENTGTHNGDPGRAGGESVKPLYLPEECVRLSSVCASFCVCMCVCYSQTYKRVVAQLFGKSAAKSANSGNMATLIDAGVY